MSNQPGWKHAVWKHAVKRENSAIERHIFEGLLAQVDNLNRGDYQGLGTSYADMSRWVAACMASTPPDQLQAIGNTFGWDAPPAVQAVDEAVHTKCWFHPAACVPGTTVRSPVAPGYSVALRSLGIPVSSSAGFMPSPPAARGD